MSKASPDQDKFRRRFDALFSSHHQDVYRYCLRRLGSSEAEDAAAEVFAVAWRRLNQIPPEERAWLLGVAYRVVGNYYRSRRRRIRLSTRLQSAPAQVPAQVTDEPRLVLGALATLRASDQELLRLSLWDDLTRSEIAQVLGINENAVDQRLHRARSRLKASFEALTEESVQVQTKGASA